MTAAPQSFQQMSAHTQTPWMWAWRDDESAPASIFSMVREGHAYAVAMCPRYQKPDQWIADAKFILEAVNSHEALKARIHELEAALEIIGNGANEVFRRWQTTGPKTREQMAEIARAVLSKGAA